MVFWGFFSPQKNFLQKNLNRSKDLLRFFFVQSAGMWLHSHLHSLMTLIWPVSVKLTVVLWLVWYFSITWYIMAQCESAWFLTSLDIANIKKSYWSDPVHPSWYMLVAFTRPKTKALSRQAALSSPDVEKPVSQEMSVRLQPPEHVETEHRNHPLLFTGRVTYASERARAAYALKPTCQQQRLLIFYLKRVSCCLVMSSDGGNLLLSYLSDRKKPSD